MFCDNSNTLHSCHSRPHYLQLPHPRHQNDLPWRTELFIVMMVYNEEEELFCRSMHGVIENIAVCIICHGRQKIDSRTLSVIAAMAHGCISGRHRKGALQFWQCVLSLIIEKTSSMTNPSQHIYRSTPRKVCVTVGSLCNSNVLLVSVSPSMKIEGAEKGVVPVQRLFCLQGEESKAAQLALLVLRRLRSKPAAQCVHSARRYSA
jgi:chitin synthase